VQRVDTATFVVCVFDEEPPVCVHLYTYLNIWLVGENVHRSTMSLVCMRVCMHKSRRCACICPCSAVLRFALRGS
jgi:hypothetical protein